MTFSLLFKADPNETLTDPQFSLLTRIWQQGQNVKKHKLTKEQIAKDLQVEVTEALILDQSFLLIVNKGEERVYEIKQ